MTDSRLRTAEALRGLARRLEELANLMEGPEAGWEGGEVSGDPSDALGACRAALEEVYTAGSTALIVMTTPLGDRATVMWARQAGSEGYFVKPVDIQKLGGWLEGRGFQAVR